MNTCFLCYAALFAFTVSTAAETVFHVTSTGSDLNPGTREKPLATLEQARHAVRMAGPGTARRVIMHGGSYELRSTFTLGPLDSGTATHRVSWQAASGESVRLVGGMSVPTSAWLPVSETPVRGVGRFRLIFGRWALRIYRPSRSGTTACRQVPSCSSTKAA